VGVKKMARYPIFGITSYNEFINNDMENYYISECNLLDEPDFIAKFGQEAYITDNKKLKTIEKREQFAKYLQEYLGSSIVNIKNKEILLFDKKIKSIYSQNKIRELKRYVNKLNIENFYYSVRMLQSILETDDIYVHPVGDECACFTQSLDYFIQNNFYDDDLTETEREYIITQVIWVHS
jgi:hypothetical protein